MRTYSASRELRERERKSTLLQLAIAPFSYVNIDIHDLLAWTIKVKKHCRMNTVTQ